MAVGVRVGVEVMYIGNGPGVGKIVPGNIWFIVTNADIAFAFVGSKVKAVASSFRLIAL
jgi:hypothetical protein